MSTAIAIVPPTIELFTWDVTRYHAAAKAGLLGSSKLELLEGIIAVVPNPDQFHEWMSRQVIQLLVEALGDAVLVDKTIQQH